MSSPPVNLLVFREDRRQVSGSELKSALAREMESSGTPDTLLRALLRAGELECGVADAAPELLAKWERVTDTLADALLSKETFSPDICLPLIHQAVAPASVHISKPEGFAYYALYPLAYAEVLDDLGPLPTNVAVIGIRSIGTTLSAIVAAAARRRGVNAGRITVRPAGHPYNRQTRFSPPQLEWVKKSLERGAAFLVVDEGPGLSGSSFLSVAEALVKAAVPAETITLICGHEPNLNSLCSDNGAQRASRFRWVAVNSRPRVPSGAEVFLGGGEWRRYSFAQEQDWPASWTSLERLKYLSSDEAEHVQLFKFTGFGHYGDAVIEREREVAGARFGPWVERECEGFVRYEWLQARPMCAGDLSQSALSRLAEYCAFRAQTFPADLAELNPLQEMAEHNLSQLRIDVPCQLELVRPVVADGRMQPHEWLLTPDSQMLKTDSGSHGDDHFFPGPTDIAWDLAGAIVEWKMNAAQSDFFLESYRRASSDNAAPRIGDFITACTAFRTSYCLMAANALQGTSEEPRLARVAAEYGTGLLRCVSITNRNPKSSPPRTAVLPAPVPET